MAAGAPLLCLVYFVYLVRFVGNAELKSPVYSLYPAPYFSSDSFAFATRAWLVCGYFLMTWL
ncbi:MAG: hypothetical protein A4E67_01368 [Syntrophaceae bacterium PtaB.Bin038]|jgi:hypothetical protein|nr:MAG: hypothetical protein A4E67_01368 [Syntrophaceae bacterium PtaB.Bin038]